MVICEFSVILEFPEPPVAVIEDLLNNRWH